MRAVVYRGPKDLRVEEVPVPSIGAREILVKVAVCGVCPTDIKKIHYGTVPPPRIFGHETSGTIVKAGAGVARLGFKFKIGDRVGLHHHVPCMDCHYCRHRAFAQCETYKRTGITAGFEPAGGGYAEYVRVMDFCLPGVVRIPRSNTFEEGAMLEPVNTVLKAVRRLNILRGDNVLVVGQGPIGLMFTRLLKLEGVNVLATDLLESRLKLAKKFGAKKTLLANQLSTIDRPFDAAVIAVPSDAAIHQSIQLVRGGGQIMLFAHTKRGSELDIDPATVCVDEKDVIGSYSSDFTLQREVAQLVFSRQLDMRPFITHRFSLKETASAVALAADPRPDSLKIVVQVAAD